MYIVGLVVKGAYDGVNHEYLMNKIRTWSREGYLNRKTRDMIIFLYSQYRLGIVEPRGSMDVKTFLVNVGVPQGSKLSCNAYNGVQDDVLKKILYLMTEAITK